MIYPYSGGSRGRIPPPGEPPAPGEPAASPDPEPAKPAAKRAKRTPAAPKVPAAPAPAPAGETSPAAGSGVGRDAGGFLLAALLWGWVILPYLAGGTTTVKDTIRAKFINKGPKGDWLP